MAVQRIMSIVFCPYSFADSFRNWNRSNTFWSKRAKESLATTLVVVHWMVAEWKKYDTIYYQCQNRIENSLSQIITAGNLLSIWFIQYKLNPVGCFPSINGHLDETAIDIHRLFLFLSGSIECNRILCATSWFTDAGGLSGHWNKYISMIVARATHIYIFFLLLSLVLLLHGCALYRGSTTICDHF